MKLRDIDNSGTVFVTLWIALIFGAALYAILRQQARAKKRKAYFASREFKELDSLILDLDLADNLAIDSAKRYWIDAARILEVPPELLRASDRFDKELEFESGMSVSEISDLRDYYMEEWTKLTAERPPPLAHTLGELVRTLAFQRIKSSR